jgi:monoamine oxidase
MEVIRKIFP